MTYRFSHQMRALLTTVREGTYLIALALLLSACDFHSIYGPHQGDDGITVANELNEISIDNIPDRIGQILRNNLIDRMYGKNRPSQPVYELKVKVHSTIEDLGILANSTSTRELMNMYGDYTLTDMHGKQILRGSAHSVAGYDRLDQMYGTVAAQQDANERTLHEISEQIVNRLSLYFAERK